LMFEMYKNYENIHCNFTAYQKVKIFSEILFERIKLPTLYILFWVYEL
jgi:hypothetical protein